MEIGDHMKVQILNTNIETRVIPANDKRGELTFRTQSAAFERPGNFVLPFKLTLDDEQAAYAPGTYEVDPESLQVDEFGAPGFGRRIKLLPVDAGVKPRASQAA